METVTVGRAVVDVLQAEGVRFVFGLPGRHALSICDALDSTPEIRHVLVRHEQAAASMAAAHAQLTGEPGVCLVTAPARRLPRLRRVVVRQRRRDRRRRRPVRARRREAPRRRLAAERSPTQ